MLCLRQRIGVEMVVTNSSCSVFKVGWVHPQDRMCAQCQEFCACQVETPLVGEYGGVYKP